ncbi:Probable bifunctional methylthioribulose-1-phosphate dehydratase/enolase-phosphatase E1 [Linum perenne]
MIKADRKITALKQLQVCLSLCTSWIFYQTRTNYVLKRFSRELSMQGHIWRTGFQNNELKGVVYDDVPEALKNWHALGIKTYIYSSGSRLAQRLIFGNTTAGDLRQFLSGFFDTNVGTKRESSSYIQISESLGVDNPSEILFLTDVVQEAVAAKAAGLEALISVRPGNAPLPENHGFETINSFLEV